MFDLLTLLGQDSASCYQSYWSTESSDMLLVPAQTNLTLSSGLVTASDWKHISMCRAFDFSMIQMYYHSVIRHSLCYNYWCHSIILSKLIISVRVELILHLAIWCCSTLTWAYTINCKLSFIFLSYSIRPLKCWAGAGVGPSCHWVRGGHGQIISLSRGYLTVMEMCRIWANVLQHYEKISLRLCRSVW